MSTRCLTHIFDENKKVLVTMYRHRDGYPDGHGKELAEFVGEIRIVNGISMDDKDHIANGMGCLAAQVIARFKSDEKAGGIYIHPPGSSDCWEEYVYEIFPQEKAVHMRVLTAEKKLLWEGPAKEFDPKKCKE